MSTPFFAPGTASQVYERTRDSEGLEDLRALLETWWSRHKPFCGDVVLDQQRRPRFDWLQSRARRTHGIDRATARRPATFVAVDLLEEGGGNLCSLPLAARRARLEVVGLTGPGFITAGVQVGRGAELLAASRAHHLEGIVAERLDSTYRLGTRIREWLRIKNRLVSELACAPE